MKKLLLAVVTCLCLAAMGPAAAQSTAPTSTPAASAEVPHQVLGGLIFVVGAIAAAVSPVPLLWMAAGSAGAIAVNK